MKKNIGTFDRIFRMLSFVVVIILYLANIIGGLTAIVLGVVSFVLALTAFISFCPIYAAFGICTLKEETK